MLCDIKCYVGLCVSFVRVIEKDNRVYRNKTKHINTCNAYIHSLFWLFSFFNFWLLFISNFAHELRLCHFMYRITSNSHKIRPPYPPLVEYDNTMIYNLLFTFWRLKTQKKKTPVCTRHKAHDCTQASPALSEKKKFLSLQRSESRFVQHVT